MSRPEELVAGFRNNVESTILANLKVIKDTGIPIGGSECGLRHLFRDNLVSFVNRDPESKCPYPFAIDYRGGQQRGVSSEKPLVVKKLGAKVYSAYVGLISDSDQPRSLRLRLGFYVPIIGICISTDREISDVCVLERAAQDATRTEAAGLLGSLATANDEEIRLARAVIAGANDLVQRMKSRRSSEDRKYKYVDLPLPSFPGDQ